MVNSICQLFLNKVGPKKKDIAISCLPELWEKRIGFPLAPRCHVLGVLMPIVLFNHSMIVKPSKKIFAGCLGNYDMTNVQMEGRHSGYITKHQTHSFPDFAQLSFSRLSLF